MAQRHCSSAWSLPGHRLATQPHSCPVSLPAQNTAKGRPHSPCMAGKGFAFPQVELAEDQSLPREPMPQSSQHTPNQPPQQGGEREVIEARQVVIGQEDEGALHPPHPPPEGEEVTTTAVQESAPPSPAHSQMAVATSLVKRVWYTNRKSELVLHYH